MLGELIKIKDMGFTHIRATYSGGGDSGQIDNIEVLKGENTEDEDFIEEEDISEFKEIDCEIIEEWINNFMLNDIEDWWNNEGGYGEVLINLSDLSYKIDSNIYITNIESFEHTGTLDLDSEEI